MNCEFTEIEVDCKNAIKHYDSIVIASVMRKEPFFGEASYWFEVGVSKLIGLI